jgi:DNA-directed RNA polymerases I, II, and III subunit RPABC4
MSREAYQVPNLESNQTAFGNGGASTTGGAVGGYTQTEAPAVRYICGECDAKSTLSQNATLRCTECGHRILYKERTKRSVFFFSLHPKKDYAQNPKV